MPELFSCSGSYEITQEMNEEYNKKVYYSFKYDNSRMCPGSVNLFEYTSGRIIKLIVYCVFALSLAFYVLILPCRMYLSQISQSTRLSAAWKIIKKATWRQLDLRSRKRFQHGNESQNRVAHKALSVTELSLFNWISLSSDEFKGAAGASLQDSSLQTNLQETNYKTFLFEKRQQWQPEKLSDVHFRFEAAKLHKDVLSC